MSSKDASSKVRRKLYRARASLDVSLPSGPRSTSSMSSKDASSMTQVVSVGRQPVLGSCRVLFVVRVV
jgi:hypothetical protein